MKTRYSSVLASLAHASAALALFSSTAVAQELHATPSKREAKLLDLAKKRFPDWKPSVDEKLFRAAATGAEASYTDQKPGDVDPSKAISWGDDRLLKADRVIWLCTDPDALKLLTHQGVRVRGARIDGDIDLEYAKIPFPLALTSCHLAKLTLANGEVRALSLKGSHTGPIQASKLKVDLNLYLRDGFKAQGEVELIGATIGGLLNCSGGEFTNTKENEYSLNADAIEVEGPVFLRYGFKAQSGVNLLGATIGGQLDCTGGEFTKQKEKGHALQAGSINVTGSVLLRDNPNAQGGGFEAHGEVRLVGATIGGQLDCTGGEFTNEKEKGYALNAERSKVAGSVYLRNRFTAQGGVNLLGATIGGQLDCINGEFTNEDGQALVAERIKVTGSVFLRGRFKAQGEVRLFGATIGGQLNCRGGEFTNKDGDALNAEGVKVKSSVHLSDGFNAHGKVDFLDGSVDGRFIWQGVKSPQNVILDLRSAKLGTLSDQAKSWPSRLYLDGLVYDRIDAESPLKSKERLAWLNRQPKDAFFPQPYKQLATVLQKAGHDAAAINILIAKEKDPARTAKLGWLQRFCQSVLGGTIAYGYRPWQVGWFILGFLILGWALFGIGWRNGNIEPINGAKESSQSPNMVMYSLDSFVPLIDFHQAKLWLPKPGWLRGYLWLHTIAGWTLTTLLVAGLTGLVR